MQSAKGVHAETNKAHQISVKDLAIPVFLNTFRQSDPELGG
jgi:hypothetical protein